MFKKLPRPVAVSGCIAAAGLLVGSCEKNTSWSPHGLVLGGIGLVLSVLGAIAMWDASHAWYPIALAASAVPCGWIGGRLAQRP